MTELAVFLAMLLLIFVNATHFGPNRRPKEGELCEHCKRLVAFKYMFATSTSTFLKWLDQQYAEVKGGGDDE
jgi:hypothetical protein